MGAALGAPPEAGNGRTALVGWRGPLDVETVARFEERLDPYLKEPDQSILLDLRRVEYIDSAGLRFLLALRERLAEARDRVILIVKRESRVERTLCLVGFDKMFEMVRKPFGALRRKRDGKA